MNIPLILNDQPKTGKIQKKAESFYDNLLKFLLENKLPFMVGGTYAFNTYTGIERPTKDIDLFTTQEDYPRILKKLSDAGYKTKLYEIARDWLAKVYDEKNGIFIDIMYGERNGLYKVDKTWLDHAQKGIVLGYDVKLVPVEELIRSKSYIQNRDRHDGPDVVHLILRQGKQLNWQLLLDKMDPHWELLTAHILNFLFVYPSERKVIPEWVIKKLMEKVKERISHEPTSDKITRGLLLSNDYEVGVSHWGFSPIRTLE